MSKEKRPYVSYTVEEITKMEASHYVIQVGGDLFSYNGKMAFSKSRVEKFFDEIFLGLREMKENGSQIEKDDAAKCLTLLKIYPLRIH